MCSHLRYNYLKCWNISRDIPSTFRRRSSLLPSPDRPRVGLVKGKRHACLSVTRSSPSTGLRQKAAVSQANSLLNSSRGCSPGSLRRMAAGARGCWSFNARLWLCRHDKSAPLTIKHKWDKIYYSQSGNLSFDFSRGIRWAFGTEWNEQPFRANACQSEPVKVFNWRWNKYNKRTSTKTNTRGTVGESDPKDMLIYQCLIKDFNS